jgi:hypothetical protein
MFRRSQRKSSGTRGATHSPDVPLDPLLGLDTITFDTFDFALESDDGDSRVWLGDGAVLSEHFFALPPDLPGLDPADLRNTYEAMISGVADVEWRRALLVELASDPSVPLARVVFRLPDIDRFSFLGSLTIPLAGCSWVVKFGAAEQGMTGVREALAFDRAMGESGGQGPDAVRATFDPYARRWDGIVPDDPLSEVRDHLDRLQSSLRLAPVFHEQTRFPGAIGKPSS